jgi:ABC-2 type transport system ATP-binding protein
MTRLTVENAWVEFHVSLSRRAGPGLSRTGGAIDTGRGVVTALRDISFELRDGDRLGLVGHNGAGKSTMLRMLAGAYPPTRGRVISVGTISTLFNTMPGVTLDGTGRENIYTAALHLGLNRSRIVAMMDEIIEFAELGDYIDLPVRIYSSGMMTRLGFSIATAVEPEILLLDEGLATGDAHFAQKAQARMNELIARSSIMVIASHSESLIAKMCTRCLLLEHGQVIADGPSANLLRSYRASVVEAAQNDSKEGLARAYELATEMVKSGELPPLELEEQGLRHALTISPDDVAMMRRYIRVLADQHKAVPPELEARMLFLSLQKDPGQIEYRDRLRMILGSSSDALSVETRDRVANLVKSETT